MLGKALLRSASGLGAVRVGLARNLAGAVPAGLKSTAEIHEFQSPDPGPPATYDDIPVPFKPFQEEYSRQNAKFNQILGLAVLWFTGSLAYVPLLSSSSPLPFPLVAVQGIYNNIWALNEGQPPKVYSQRLPRTEKDSPVY